MKSLNPIEFKHLLRDYYNIESEYLPLDKIVKKWVPIENNF